jgi:rhomboid family GlyGly-CTERM serine protease
VFDRTKIAAGEWWRVWTGQFAHFGLGHLAWNLAVIVPAGLWSETVAPLRTRAFLLLAPWLIGAALYFGDHRLERYAGLSGVAAGLLILLSLVQLSDPARRDRWFWGSVLGLIGVKVLSEMLAGDAVFVRFPSADVQPVPLSHVAGIMVGAVVQLLGRKERKRLEA